MTIHYVSLSYALKKALPRRALCGRVVTRGNYAYATNRRDADATRVTCKTCLEKRWPRPCEARFVIRSDNP